MSLSLLLVSVATANPALDGYDNVVLDFTGPNCLYCQQMDPIVSRLQRAGYPIVKVDVTTKRHLFEQMNVTGMPTFVLIVNGREVTRRTGKMTPAELQRMCEQIPRRAPQTPVANATNPQGRGPSQPGPRSLEDPQRADNPRSRFEFPFPFAGGGSESLANGGRSDAPATPAAANQQPSTSSPSDWDRPIIRAQNGRTPRTQTHTADVPLASSARIRVRDNGGTVYASATIIDSRPGRSVLLTCGHVFRDLPETAEIVVDVFVNGQIEQYRGQVVDFDLESDVGLLAIGTSDPLPTSPISGGKSAPSLGTALYSIGCGGGEPPTRHEVRVTGFQRNTPPTYIECTGAPQQGRSGGGLFNPAGEVIGVCFAADAPKDRGLYASLPSVWRLLNRCGLPHLYRPAGAEPSRSAEAAQETLAGHEEPRPGPAAEQQSESAPAGEAPPFAAAAPAAANPTATASAVDNQQLAAVEQALAQPEDMEVICVIRPRNRPAAASRIVVIHRATPKFVSFLTGELRRPQETARRVGFESEGSETSASASTGERFFAALRGQDEPFSHFEMSAGTGSPSDGRTSLAAASRSDARRSREGMVERYRRSAASRVAWPVN